MNAIETAISAFAADSNAHADGVRRMNAKISLNKAYECMVRAEAIGMRKEYVGNHVQDAVRYAKDALRLLGESK